MAEVVWSPTALRDLEGILAYIAQNAPTAAQRFGRRIVARARQLKTDPLLGGIVLEDTSRTYRELLCGNYRIIYRCDEDATTAYIIAVHHTARPLNAADLN